MNYSPTTGAKSSRRSFLRKSATTAAGFYIIPRHVLGGKGYIAPSDKVNIGVVGVGGRGKQNVNDLLALSDVQVTAIADPAVSWNLDEFYYKGTAGRGPVKKMVEEHYAKLTPNSSVAEYEDFRMMLEKEPEIDAILCATPDHTHAYVSLLSMYAGKHVYCEKPLTHNIWEARLVQRVAKETGLATQMGNQMHSTDRIRNAVEHLRAGTIGKIKEIHSWVPATRWIKELDGVPKETDTIPGGLDWELWLGPRATRPFNRAYVPVTWRDFWDFGCGAMGDFGCHDLDAATWGLNLPSPTTVEMRPAGYSDENITPYGEIGYFTFDGQDGLINLTWYSGGLQPARPGELPMDFKFGRRGAMYVGDKGLMVTGGDPYLQIYRNGVMQEDVTTPSSLAPTNGHHRDWVDAIKGGPAASSNFDYGAHLTETTLLGVLSLRLGGEKIYWDGKNLKAKGLPQADEIIREPVRSGWEMGG